MSKLKCLFRKLEENIQTSNKGPSIKHDFNYTIKAWINQYLLIELDMNIALIEWIIKPSESSNAQSSIETQNW